MNLLSEKAINELTEILRKEFGEAFVYELSKEDLQELGNLFMFMTAESLKIRLGSKLQR